MSYSDYCSVCDKKFTVRHYSWFICMKCHKNNPHIDEYDYEERLKNKEELED